jgi:hypothetical protein
MAIQLQIECTGGETLGTCYYASYFKIKSFNKKLTDKDIDHLYKMGFLGHGQDFKYEAAPDEMTDKYNRFYVYTATSKCDSSG